MYYVGLVIKNDFYSRRRQFILGLWAESQAKFHANLGDAFQG